MRDIEELAAEIRSHYRSFVFAQDTRKSMDLRLGAFLRVQLGWSKELPEDERKVRARVSAPRRGARTGPRSLPLC